MSGVNFTGPRVEQPMAGSSLHGEYLRAVKVTVSDPDTGEVLGEKVIRNDYVLVCAGRRYVKSWQVWGRTHQVNIAYDTKPQP